MAAGLCTRYHKSLLQLAFSVALHATDQAPTAHPTTEHQRPGKRPAEAQALNSLPPTREEGLRLGEPECDVPAGMPGSVKNTHLHSTKLVGVAILERHVDAGDPIPAPE